MRSHSLDARPAPVDGPLDHDDRHLPLGNPLDEADTGFAAKEVIEMTAPQRLLLKGLAMVLVLPGLVPPLGYVTDGIWWLAQGDAAAVTPLLFGVAAVRLLLGTGVAGFWRPVTAGLVLTVFGSLIFVLWVAMSESWPWDPVYAAQFASPVVAGLLLVVSGSGSRRAELGRA
jgi:hypothetical protein